MVMFGVEGDMGYLNRANQEIKTKMRKRLNLLRRLWILDLTLSNSKEANTQHASAYCALKVLETTRVCLEDHIRVRRPQGFRIRSERFFLEDHEEWIQAIQGVTVEWDSTFGRSLQDQSNSVNFKLYMRIPEHVQNLLAEASSCRPHDRL